MPSSEIRAGLLILLLSFPAIKATIKCCARGSEISVSDEIVHCTNKTSNRIEVRTKLDDFLSHNIDGQCLDSSSSGAFEYVIEKQNLVKTIRVEPNFRKCCPLMHSYNPESRSCDYIENLNESYIQSDAIHVGLTHCKLILDIKLNNLQEIFERTKNINAADYCVDRVGEEFILRVCQKDFSVCQTKRCLKKCCPDGQSFVQGGVCRDTFIYGFNSTNQIFSPYIEDASDDFEVIYNTKCQQVSLFYINKIQYTILKDGRIRYYYNYTESFVETKLMDFTDYCIEHVIKGKIFGHNLFWCVAAKKMAAKFTWTLWAKILSAVFLVLTVVIYLYLQETKSTFGKILISYCFATFCLFTVLILSNFSVISGAWCRARAYMTVFFHLSAFAWVNIMSLDIWWTFSTPKRAIGNDQRKKDLKKYLVYCLYGWGVPLCNLALILAFDLTKILPRSIHPYVGVYYCLLEDRNYARILFSLTPQLIFQIVNTILFVKTVVYCIRVKNEINRMNHSSKSNEKNNLSANKERLLLITKLSIIMGFVWIFEVVTAFFPNMKTYNDFTKILEIIFDNITCLQGVFIFIIFICKKKTLDRIRAKIGCAKPEYAHSTSFTQSSRATGSYPITNRQTSLSVTD